MKRERSKTIIWFSLVIFSSFCGVLLIGWKFPEIKNFYSEIRSEIYTQKAKDALSKNNLTAARIFLQNAFRHTPGKAELVDLYIELVLKDSSQDVLPLLMLKDVQNPALKYSLMMLENALENNRHLAVAPHLRQILSRYPNDSQAHFLSGKVFLGLGMFEQAESCLQRSLSLQPDNIPARIELASLHLTHPDSKKSETARGFLETIRNNGGNWHYVATRALADFEFRNNPKEAEKLYRDILLNHQDDWHSRIRLLILSAQNDSQQAQEQIKLLWKLATDKYKKYELLLNILKTFGADETLVWASKLNEQDLANAKIRLVYLRALWDKGFYQEAIKLASKETSSQTTLLEKALLLYWVYKSQKLLDQEIAAKGSLQKLCELAKTEQATAIIFSNELISSGQPDLGLSLLESASQGKNNSLSTMALQGLFKYYKERSNISGLISVHESLLKIYPENTLLFNNLAVLLALNNTDLVRAQKLAESAYLTLPSFPAIVCNYAHILALQGKMRQSLGLLETINPSDYTDGMKLQRAHVLFLCGLKEEARNSVENINTSEFMEQELNILKKIRSASNDHNSTKQQTISH